MFRTSQTSFRIITIAQNFHSILIIISLQQSCEKKLKQDDIELATGTISSNRTEKCPLIPVKTFDENVGET